MRNLSTRVIIVLLFLGMTATASPLWLYPGHQERGSTKATKLPLTIGEWFGEEIPIDDHIKEILETDDLVQRNYTNPSLRNIPVQMAVVFSADNRRVAHPPEVCYTGAGFEITDKKIVNLAGLPPMVQLILTQGPAHVLVLYDYKSGNDLTANYYGQQLNIALNALRRRSMASALLRFSTPLLDSENVQAGEERIAGLARLMMPQIQKTLAE